MGILREDYLVFPRACIVAGIKVPAESFFFRLFNRTSVRYPSRGLEDTVSNRLLPL